VHRCQKSYPHPFCDGGPRVEQVESLLLRLGLASHMSRLELRTLLSGRLEDGGADEGAQAQVPSSTLLPPTLAIYGCTHARTPPTAPTIRRDPP
jgi:hypothetical protein